MLSNGVRGDEEDEMESKSKYESTSMMGFQSTDADVRRRDGTGGAMLG